MKQEARETVRTFLECTHSWRDWVLACKEFLLFGFGGGGRKHGYETDCRLVERIGGVGEFAEIIGYMLGMVRGSRV